MGNCLVTKLKATVDNSSLKKIGVIKMRIVVGDNAQINRMAQTSTLGSAMKIKALGDGYFTTTKGGNISIGNEVTFSQEVFPVQGDTITTSQSFFGPMGSASSIVAIILFPHISSISSLKSLALPKRVSILNALNDITGIML